MNELRLSEIWIYPIKSLGGIPMNEITTAGKGIEYDRRWMLIDDTNTFITQRIHPVMSQFKLSKTESGFTINFKNNSLELKFSQKSLPELLTATIWNDTVQVCEVSKEHSAWFSEMLGMPCKLVSFPEENERAVDPDFAINNDHVSLADAYPYLIIGQSSLDYLNIKLDKPVPMNRFRPNFVFTGGEPHIEDTWRDFKIGEAEFIGVKPCSRCVLTTVNQETGEKGVEPLRTLNMYRKFENKILFGQNLLSLNRAKVKVGDQLIIESFQPSKIEKVES